MPAYEGRRCLKSCPAYYQTTSCSCGQPGDPDYRQKRPNEDLDASEGVYMETQSRVVGLREDLRRLRIAHLRRMADAIDGRASGWADVLRTVPDYPSLQPRDKWRRRWLARMEKLHAAINAEIARLRGEG